MNILFVCTGNICRSPMAEHLMKKKLSDLGRRDVGVLSAGVSAEVGMGCTREAREALKKFDVSAVSHVAQQATRKLISWSDLVLAMEAHHKNRLIYEFEESASKVHVLKTYAGTGQDKDGVLDPYGYPLTVYEKVLSEIDEAITRILKKI